MQQMAIEGGKGTLIDTEGIENKTLSIKSSNVEQRDCLLVATGDYGKSAASIGFDKLICRNSISDERWSYTLAP